MTTRGQVNSNFYQIVDVDVDGNPTQVKPEYINIGNVGNAYHANYADVANSVSVSNVTGIGNIATTNYDGNSSHVLYGNGVWANVAGGSNTANANYANFAGTVTASNQPNITSTGTLASLTVTGNVTAQNFTGNVSISNLNTNNITANNIYLPNTTVNNGIVTTANLQANYVIANTGYIGTIAISNNNIYSSNTSQDINIGQATATANINFNRVTVFNKPVYANSSILNLVDISFLVGDNNLHESANLDVVFNFESIEETNTPQDSYIDDVDLEVIQINLFK